MEVLGSTVRVTPLRKDPGNGSGEDWRGVEGLLSRVTTGLGVPPLTLCPDLSLTDLPLFERVVSNRLALEDSCPASAGPVPEVDEVIAEVVAGSFVRNCTCRELVSFDGAPLRAYASGKQDGDVVVIASACGMPVELCERWIRHLEGDHLVITWESRGLFGDADFDRLAYDETAQAGDLLAVMDHFGVKTAHLMGLCGGAVIALAAAARHPERVSSLSLWHGDYELGAACPKTNHQHDLKALLGIAGGDRTSAVAMHSVFCRSMLRNPLPDLAHLILYPYATPEWLYRYSRLNGSIMDADVGSLLDKVGCPTLVVTSEDDDKAHPAGSRQAAARLANATLCVEPHGDHISLFNAEPSLKAIASRFLQTGFSPA